MNTDIDTVRAVFQPLASMRTEDDLIRHPERLQAFLYDYMARHDFTRAAACLDLLLELTAGEYRDDGITPASYHPMAMAAYTIFAHTAGFHIPDMENLLCVDFWHDIIEDKEGWGPERLKSYLDNKIGPSPANDRVVEDVWRLSKKVAGVRRFPDEPGYLANILDSATGVITKLQDHTYNLASGPQGMEEARLTKYCVKTVQNYPAFIGQARERYPQYVDIIDRHAWLMSEQLGIIRPALRSTFNYHSGFREEDKGFPTCLGPLSMPRGAVDRLNARLTLTGMA